MPYRQLAKLPAEQRDALTARAAQILDGLDAL